MKALDYSINAQLKKLIADGLSIEDAAEILNLDVDACKFSLTIEQNQHNSVDISCDELIAKHKPECLRALIEIGLDSSLDNINARVAALKIIIEGKGKLPEVAADKLSDIYSRMRLVTEKYDKELETSKAKLADAANTPAKEQTTVVIHNENVTKSTRFDEKYKNNGNNKTKEKELCHTR